MCSACSTHVDSLFVRLTAGVFHSHPSAQLTLQSGHCGYCTLIFPLQRALCHFDSYVVLKKKADVSQPPVDETHGTKFQQDAFYPFKRFTDEELVKVILICGAFALLKGST